MPAALVADPRRSASFGSFTPAVARNYDTAAAATVVSTAGDATLSVTDPSTTAPGHLVNGTFALPSAAATSAPPTRPTRARPSRR